MRARLVVVVVLAATAVSVTGCTTSPASQRRPSRVATAPVLPSAFPAATPASSGRAVTCVLRLGHGVPARTVGLTVPAAYTHATRSARFCSWSDDQDDAVMVRAGAGVTADARAELDPARNGSDAGNSSGARDLRYRAGVRALAGLSGERLEYASDAEGVPILVQERGSRGLVLACVARGARAGAARRAAERRLCSDLSASVSLR